MMTRRRVLIVVDAPFALRGRVGRRRVRAWRHESKLVVARYIIVAGHVIGLLGIVVGRPVLARSRVWRRHRTQPRRQWSVAQIHWARVNHWPPVNEFCEFSGLVRIKIN